MVIIRSPNGYGSVYKLQGKRRAPWVARVQIGTKIGDNGKKQPVYNYLGYFPTQREAKECLADYNAAKTPHGRRVALGTLWAEYEAAYGDRWPTNTRRAKMQSWGVLEPYADMDINRINVTMYEELFRASGLNKPKLRQAKSLINLLYDFAVKKQYTTPDYAAFIRYIEIDAGNPNTLPHKRIPREVIAELWTRSDDINVQCILFMIYTGVRISEFVSVKPEDVERDAKMFTVRESKTAAGKNRRVPIADKVLPIVDGWLSLGYKFLAPYPNIWRQTSPDGAFRYSFKKALPEYSPHDTRYTCVSELTEAGAPAAVIRSIVGHKDANVTARYTQISDDVKLKWINEIEI